MATIDYNDGEMPSVLVDVTRDSIFSIFNTIFGAEPTLEAELNDKTLGNGAKSHCQLKLNNASRHFNNIFFKIQVLHSLSEFFEMAVSPYDS